MFFIFDIDDLFEGQASAIGLGLKLFIIVGLLSFPLGLLKYGGSGAAISLLAFAFIITGFLINIFTIMDAIKKIASQYSKKDLKEREVYPQKLIRNAYIVIFAIIILSIIGWLFPVYLNLINLKFSNLTSMMLLPFLFNIIYCFLLNSWLNTGKANIKSYFEEFKEYIVNILVGRILLITAIIFFIFSVIVVLGTQDSDFKGSIFNTKVKEFVIFVTNQIQCYDEKYELNRSNDFSIEKSVEDEMYYIKKELSKEPKEIDKLYEGSVGTNREAFEDENTFTARYLISKTSESLKEYKKKYGLSISIYQSFEEENIWILKVYDSMYEKAYYYKYDLTQCKITESFENKANVDDRIYEYNKSKH